MRRYILNSPVLTSFGVYRFEEATLDAARHFALQGAHSAIGHSGTAVFLSTILGIDVPFQRIPISMEPGDRALVFRLLGRPPEGVILSAEQMAAIPYELGFLTQITQKETDMRESELKTWDTQGEIIRDQAETIRAMQHILAATKQIVEASKQSAALSKFTSSSLIAELSRRGMESALDAIKFQQQKG